MGGVNTNIHRLWKISQNAEIEGGEQSYHDTERRGGWQEILMVVQGALHQTSMTKAFQGTWQEPFSKHPNSHSTN